VNNSDGSKGGGPLNSALAPPLAIDTARSWQAGVNYGARHFLRNRFPYDQNDHMEMVILGIDLPACLSYCQSLFAEYYLKSRASLLRKSHINMSNKTVKSSECKFKREKPEPFFTSCKAVIVLMEPDETEEQAWRNHLNKHPEDVHADVRIFHVY
jgi:hypothetical protein